MAGAPCYQAGVPEQVTDSGLRASLAELLPQLRAFARYLAGSRADADDLVQEVVVRTLRSLDGQPGPDDLKSWCLTTLRNIFYETHRRRRREVGFQAAAEQEVAEPRQEAPGTMRDLSRAMAGLPTALREALLLVGAQGLSYEQAATVCAVPVGTMKARVSRARRALGEALGRVMR